jgi:hypothetical protein
MPASGRGMAIAALSIDAGASANSSGEIQLVEFMVKTSVKAKLGDAGEPPELFTDMRPRIGGI